MVSYNPEWDWGRRELRDQLEVGTVLMELDDCACLRVSTITPEGVIMPTLFSNGVLFTWDELTRGKWIIYQQPQPGQPASDPTPRLMERGGRFDAAVLPPNETLEPPSVLPGDSADDVRLDRGAVAAMIRLFPDPRSFASMKAVARAGQDGTFAVAVMATDASGAQHAASASPELHRMIGYVHREMLERWTMATLEVAPDHGDAWRYEFQFAYAWSEESSTQGGR